MRRLETPNFAIRLVLRGLKPEITKLRIALYKITYGARFYGLLCARVYRCMGM